MNHGYSKLLIYGMIYKWRNHNLQIKSGILSLQITGTAIVSNFINNNTWKKDKVNSILPKVGKIINILFLSMLSKIKLFGKLLLMKNFQSNSTWA